MVITLGQSRAVGGQEQAVLVRVLTSLVGPGIAQGLWGFWGPEGREETNGDWMRIETRPQQQ